MQIILQQIGKKTMNNLVFSNIFHIFANENSFLCFHDIKDQTSLLKGNEQPRDGLLIFVLLYVIDIC